MTSSAVVVIVKRALLISFAMPSSKDLDWRWLIYVQVKGVFCSNCIPDAWEHQHNLMPQSSQSLRQILHIRLSHSSNALLPHLTTLQDIYCWLELPCRSPCWRPMGDFDKYWRCHSNWSSGITSTLITSDLITVSVFAQDEILHVSKRPISIRSSQTARYATREKKGFER